ncbi:arsenic resistance N-acetyltransferase ArsN2 [Neorhizobium petrolearium]|uniref:arsenic resistance N-acetyltransferase ArsN2 n=1 Tax=Neorhizobium petrolearium TaxID=515361 RepID=UPI003F15795F
MTILLETIEGSDPGLRKALAEAALPVEDLEEEGRSFFRAIGGDGKTLGYTGIEHCDDSVLLRSVVVLPEYRGRGFAKALVGETLKQAPETAAVFLATTTAAPLFERMGFVPVNRSSVPAAILSTRQLSGICPASATIMKRSRPPT